MELHSLNVPIIKRQIATNLRRYRREAGKTQEQALACVGASSVSKRITHLEGGRNLPSEADIEALLVFYGRSATEVQEMQEQARAVRAAPTQRQLRLPELPANFKQLLDLESGAVVIRTWMPLVIDGLLQTEDYARGLMAGHVSGLSAGEVARRVDLRMKRQEVLWRDEPSTLQAVVDEATLRRCPSGRDVQRAQLAHLLRVSERPGITLNVIALQDPVNAALHGAHKIVELPIPGDPGLVWLEDRTGGRLVEDADVIDDFLDVQQMLVRAALSEEESRALITKMMGEI
ncbi:helix-turn-helix transcriptional regulator [Saccharopolyspora gloriosae]|uniref:helix-turn-helix domain-containing protein n=1 Tax=Saccharopolyspora gloriosae TaxID=455344 RepID=UPI001FB59669|nr:helix-turn-helix transcriptional regulator [Saccharopolyspora gloriosae]